MLSRAAILLLPVLALAQTQPVSKPTAPPEVDTALRARVTEFLQYHVDGNFRKAYDMVAEDTKDYYFAASKIRLLDFKITDVDYSGADDFTSAKVTAVVTRMWNIQRDAEKVVVPMVTTWKVENGKWMWFYDEKSNKRLMSMGESDVDSMRKSAESGKMPDLSPEAIRARALKIMKPSTLDKSEVTLATGKESVETVTFHNGYPGSVMLTTFITTPIPGFTAEVKKSTLGVGEDAVLELRYKPTGNAPPKIPTTVELRLQPFEQIYAVDVKFADKLVEGPAK